MKSVSSGHLRCSWLSSIKRNTVVPDRSAPSMKMGECMLVFSVLDGQVSTIDGGKAQNRIDSSRRRIVPSTAGQAMSLSIS